MPTNQITNILGPKDGDDNSLAGAYSPANGDVALAAASVLTDANGYLSSVLSVSEGGSQTVAIAAGVATDTVIKAAPGVLCNVLVTAAGTGAPQFFDNKTAGSGLIIGGLVASAALYTLVSFRMPAANGITLKGNAANPALTVSFS